MFTILLAEDDPDDQELLAEAFFQVDTSIRLISFNTGKKILNYLAALEENDIPNMILIDYNIPEMNGAELLDFLQKDSRYHAIVKIVWSTSNAPSFENSCLALGASAYLVKPASISELKDLAKKILSYAAKD